MSQEEVLRPASRAGEAGVLSHHKLLGVLSQLRVGDSFSVLGATPNPIRYLVVCVCRIGERTTTRIGVRRFRMRSPIGGDHLPRVASQVDVVPDEKALGPTRGGGEVGVLLLYQPAGVLAHVLNRDALSAAQQLAYLVRYLLVQLTRVRYLSPLAGGVEQWLARNVLFL